jgi:hypothetical protein
VSTDVLGQIFFHWKDETTLRSSQSLEAAVFVGTQSGQTYLGHYRPENRPGRYDGWSGLPDEVSWSET